MIYSLPPLLKKPIGEVTHREMPVSYSWGNVDALHKWIAAMNKKQVDQLLGLPGAKKYPLIWLVEGWECEESIWGLTFEKVVFHIACNSEIKTLTENRQPNFDLLYAVANDLITQLKIYLRIADKSVKYTERANFSTSKSSDTSNDSTHTYDVWDTLIVSMNLNINTHCLKALR